MGANSHIAWTHHTFNPWWGCTKVSPACDNCYAERESAWRGFGPNPKDAGKFPIWGKDARRRFFSDHHWAQLEKWNAQARPMGERHRVFIGSMCDLMESRADLDPVRERLFDLVPKLEFLDLLFLTKRPQEYRHKLPKAWVKNGCPENVWLMTTVETEDYLWRIQCLREIPAVIHGLSIEPLLGPMPALGMFLDHIEWVIVGGESGTAARPPEVSWVYGIHDECKLRGIPFFFKQWGEYLPALQDGAALYSEETDFTKQILNSSDVPMRLGVKAAGRLLDGCEYSEFPEAPVCV